MTPARTITTPARDPNLGRRQRRPRRAPLPLLPEFPAPDHQDDVRAEPGPSTAAATPGADADIDADVAVAADADVAIPAGPAGTRNAAPKAASTCPARRKFCGNHYLG